MYKKSEIVNYIINEINKLEKLNNAEVIPREIVNGILTDLKINIDKLINN